MTITFENVTKVFPGGRGIFDIQFTLQPGQITVLVGSNGAGKSTIINVLMHLLKPDNGVVSRSQHDVRYMPDDLSFPDTLTAREIMHFLGSLKGIPLDEQQHVLQLVGLEEAKHMKVKQFSKGMRQRLNLAQSLMGDSTCYILDEPTNGLDPYWIAKLKQLLEAEKERDQMVLFSTHLLSLAQEIADQVILIDHGRIVATGRVTDLCAQHHCDTLEEVWLTLTKGQTTR